MVHACDRDATQRRGYGFIFQHMEPRYRNDTAAIKLREVCVEGGIMAVFEKSYLKLELECRN